MVFMVAFSILFGIKNPPEKLNAIDLSAIEKVIVNQGQSYILSDKERELWKSLNFTMSTDNYPGETPDYVIDLIGNESSFTAMYNESSEIVFFSFVSEIRYGFLNSPPPGGWTKPIYETQANERLLELLKVK